MKNLKHHFRRMPLYPKGHRLLPIRSMSPERLKTLVVYLKAFSVGVACAVILLFPMLYYAFHKPILSAAAPSPTRASWTHVVATHKQVIALPDGSRITLLKGSRLSYPSDFNAQERKVVSYGEAYFQIRHDSTKPFEIITPTSIIRDLGTAFLLRSSDSTQVVMVTEGEVCLTSKKNKATRIKLLAGEAATLHGNKISRQEPELNALASFTGMLRFKGTNILVVAEDLSHYYNTSITIAPNLRKSKIAVTHNFDNAPIENILHHLQLEYGIGYKKTATGYLLYKKNLMQRIINQLN